MDTTLQNKLASELIDTLAAEARLFETFLDLLDSQREMIVSNDIIGLSAITERQHEKVTESKILDRRRRELVTALAQEAQLEGDVTISSLLKVATGERASHLSDLRDTILDLNKKIERSKERNGFLIERSRKVIHETLKAISLAGEPSDGAAVYARPTRRDIPEAATHRSVALDRKV